MWILSCSISFIISHILPLHPWTFQVAIVIVLFDCQCRLHWDPVWFRVFGIWVLAKEHFSECWSAGPTPQTPTWRTRVSYPEERSSQPEDPKGGLLWRRILNYFSSSLLEKCRDSNTDIIGEFFYPHVHLTDHNHSISGSIILVFVFLIYFSLVK
jgi:hypothetical protein